MTVPQTDILQRIIGSVGYGGAILFGGLTLAEWDLVLRIAVGAVSFLSILVHLVFKIRSELRKPK